MSRQTWKVLWDKVERRLRESADGVCDSDVLEVAKTLTRQGEYPAKRLLQSPELAAWLTRTRWRFEPMPLEALRGELEAYLDADRVDDREPSKAGISRRLREFRHRHLLRIFLREIEGASLRQTTAEVSDVAQVCFAAALNEAALVVGEPSLVERICIIAMGKLGGRELNFSSDVDVVFVGADDLEDGTEERAAERLARMAVELMDDVTEYGRVFRVDLRLRPEGSRGRLIPRESGLVEYCLNWGRTWERGAWLKARPLAGDMAMGRKVLESLEPFLYRRHLDFEAIDELRRMKELVDEEARAADYMGVSQKAGRESSQSASTNPFKARLLRRLGAQSSPTMRGAGGDRAEDIPFSEEPMGWDVKLGRGGIREIEFFVQALQLVHCGLRPELRVRSTLDALDRLLYAGLVAAREHGQLADGYDLFRRLEHRVQMSSDRQSHRLPKSWERFAELAQRMGLTARGLQETVVEARRQVRSIFDRLFEESPKRSERPTVGEQSEGVLERIIGLPAERLLEDSVVRRLGEAGFSRPRQVAGQLQVLRRKGHGPFSESPASADPQVARYLLAAVRDAPDPEGALGRLVSFATNVGDAPSMWSMLAQNPHAARLLIHLFGSSPPLGGLLASEPEMFERLIYTGSARVVRSREEMEDDLGKRLSGTADRSRRLGRIHRFHREEIVRLALHEVAGAVEVETTCRQLSDLAELVLHGLFREVVAEFSAAQEGFDVDGDPVATLGLSVVGMGKFGGGEMGFGSDLDFIFVYEPDESGGLDHEAATRLARRLVRVLSAPATGDLYEVDLRLRPSGSRGALVVSFDAWCDYHRRRAQFWERLALLRARPLTGTPELRQRLEKRRRQLVFEREVPETAIEEIDEIRRKLREQAGGDEGGFDVKFGRGGLVDAEFSTQWLQLRFCHGRELRRARSTFAALRALRDSVAHPPGGVELAGMLRDYAWLRRLELRLAISGQGNLVPHRGPALRALARQMGHQGRGGVEQFQAELDVVRRRMSEIWKAVFQ